MNLERLKGEIGLIFTWNKSDRLWQMPFFAGLNVAVILFISAYFKRPDLGLISMIGTTIFLYIPNTSMYHRMIVLMSCGFGIGISFTLGLIGHFFHF